MDELEQKIVELQNQISELKQFVSYGNYSNTIMQNKNLIQTNGAMQSPNYVENVSGWALDSEGVAHLQGAVIGGYPKTTDLGDMAFEDLVEAAKLGSTVITGGYIKTSLLTADNIQAGTLTGRTIRTASSGHRVVIDGSTDDITFFNSSGDETLFLDGAGTSAGYSQMSVGGGMYLSNNVNWDYQYGTELYSGSGDSTNFVIHPIGFEDNYFFFTSKGDFQMTGDITCDDIDADNIYGDIFANNGIDAVIEDVNGDFFLFSDGILILQY